MEGLAGKRDHFLEAQGGDDYGQEEVIHIRIQQRNGRKTLTTVQGIHTKFDLKRRGGKVFFGRLSIFLENFRKFEKLQILNHLFPIKLVRACKKEFACNGTVVEHKEHGEVLQFQGDQRNNIRSFLIKIQLTAEENLKMHGF